MADVEPAIVVRDSWRTVRSFGGLDAPMQAELVRLELEAAGLEVNVLDSATAGVDPVLGAAASVRLQVREADAAEADRLIRASLERQRLGAPARLVGSARPFLGSIGGAIAFFILLGVTSRFIPLGLATSAGKFAVLALFVLVGRQIGRRLDRGRCSKCRATMPMSAVQCTGCGSPF